MLFTSSCRDGYGKIIRAYEQFQNTLSVENGGSGDKTIQLASKIATFLFVVVATLLTLYLGVYGTNFLERRLGAYATELLKNIHVEIYGLIFDLVFISIILLSYQKRRDQKQAEQQKHEDRELTIRRYREEIEDYLGWEAEEAKYRIIGNIKRLNRLGITNINLVGAYFVGASLWGANLKGAFLWYAHLERTSLSGTHLEGAALREAHLEGAGLWKTYLKGANLREAHLDGAGLESITYDDKTNWEYITYNDKTKFPLLFKIPETAVNTSKLEKAVASTEPSQSGEPEHHKVSGKK